MVSLVIITRSYQRQNVCIMQSEYNALLCSTSQETEAPPTIHLPPLMVVVVVVASGNGGSSDNKKSKASNAGAI